MRKFLAHAILALVSVGVLSMSARAEVNATFRLGLPLITEESVAFGLLLDFSADAGERLVYFGLDVTESDAMITSTGSDYSLFSFTKASPLLDDWEQIPNTEFGPDARQGVAEFETASSIAPAVDLVLGTLELNTADISPAEVFQISIEAANSVIGVEITGQPGTFRFVNVGFEPGVYLIPEPSSIALALIGLLITWTCRRRKLTV